MEGNLWLVQCKRERDLGPKAVSKILSDIDSKSPPYGYILTAPAAFSKNSYDVFREELRKKGVMEFYLWGRPELEDKLHLPKNDRILFTFFGFSLVSRRRSRTTAIRAAVNIKNKLYKILPKADSDGFNSVLIRDLKDTNYPYEDKYKDFDKRPRWHEYIAYAHHPLGIWTHNRKYYAYIDRLKKEWDFTREVDLLARTIVHDVERQASSEKQRLVGYTWEFLPRAQQGFLVINGFVRYEDIVLVDAEGDNYFDFPHLYVDFVGDDGPFSSGQEFLQVGRTQTFLDDDWKKIDFFPKKFTKQKIGKVYSDRAIALDKASLDSFKKYGSIDALYAADDRFDFLKQRDVVSIADAATNSDPGQIQVTSKFESSIKDYLNAVSNSLEVERSIKHQLGREHNYSDRIKVLEFKRIYHWELEE